MCKIDFVNNTFHIRSNNAILILALTYVVFVFQIKDVQFIKTFTPI